jgi:hypothetical protein
MLVRGYFFLKFTGSTQTGQPGGLRRNADVSELPMRPTWADPAGLASLAVTRSNATATTAAGAARAPVHAMQRRGTGLALASGVVAIKTETEHAGSTRSA